MSQTPPDSYGISAGFSAGLQIWLLFLLGFLLVGYSPILSILLGAIAGLAGGLVFAWWKSKEDPNQIMDQTLEESPEEIRRNSFRKRQKSTKKKFQRK